MTDNDYYELSRFVDAHALQYDDALQEISNGCKQTHWMWFMFPQIEGLGSSRKAIRYSISCLDEAIEFTQHPILYPRYLACVEQMLTHQDLSAHDLFGSPDDLKCHASLTLFHHAAPQELLIQRALDSFYHGVLHAQTNAILSELGDL